MTIQWHAHEVLHDADDADALEDVDAAAVSPAEPPEEATASEAMAAVVAVPVAAPAEAAVAPLPPLRKSVTYQPDPFNWKPAAVSCFLNVAAPQAGQSVSG